MKIKMKEKKEENKMDLFNKKKIKELEDDVRLLKIVLKEKCIEINELKENIGLGGTFPRFSYMLYILNHLRAIEDYLKIDIISKEEDDTNLPKPKPPQIIVWKAVKWQKKNKIK